MTEGSETVQISWRSKVTGQTGRGAKISVSPNGITQEGYAGLKRELDSNNPSIEHTVTVRNIVPGRGISKVKTNS